MFKRLLGIAGLILLMSATALAGGGRRDGIALAQIGTYLRPTPGGFVRVCTMPTSGTPCNTLAHIYSDVNLTSEILPQGIARVGSDAKYTYYADNTKLYREQLYGTGVTVKTYDNIALLAVAFSGASSNLTYITVGAEGALVNSRRLVNGTNTTVDTSVSGQIKINASGTDILPLNNSWTGTNLFGAAVTFTGPQPWIDLSAVGGKPYTAAGDSTATCVSGNAHITVGSGSYDYVVGDGIAAYGCSAAPATAVPSITAVTQPTGSTPGSTTYQYKIVGIDAHHGYTAASAGVSTTTGNATLSFLNDNLITWTCNPNFVGYVVFRVSPSPTQLGFTDDCQYSDVGYQTHTKLTQLSFPATTAPTVAHAGVLSTTIAAISGTDYTLADAPTANVAALGARIIHDGSKPAQNAIATLGALGGGTIRVCIGHSDVIYFNSFVDVDQHQITIDGSCGDGPSQTPDNTPVYRVSGTTNNLRFYMGTFGSQALSIGPVGTLNDTGGGTFYGTNFTGPWGSIYQSGQSYNLAIEHSHFSGGGNLIEFAPTSLPYKFHLNFSWFQAGAVCSLVAHFGDGNSTHDWEWANNTFEGFDSQACPQQAGLQFGAINQFTETSDVFSDFAPSTPAFLWRTGYGGGSISVGVNKYTCINCDFANSNGGVFDGSNGYLGGGQFKLDGGQYIATGGTKALPDGCIYDLNIVGGNMTPAYDPTTNTCGPTTAINTTAIDGYPNSGLKVFAATTGVTLLDASHPIPYYIGAFVAGNCLETVGTAGQIADTGSPCGAGGGGSGTVTSVAVGNLSPLFTTNVANPTTAAAATFALTNAAANKVFANCTGSTAAPSYCSITTAMLPATVPITTTGLAQFAATTSLQLRGVISDETGAGLSVFNDTPTLLTPAIASFANATHTHLNASGGGTLSGAIFSAAPTCTTPAGCALGSSAVPFSNVHIGNAANQEFSFGTDSLTGSRVVTVPNANTVLPVGITASANNFLTGLAATTGVFTLAQPSFSNLSGSLTCAQLPALTGVISTAGGTCTTTGSSITLETNGSNNSSQSLLNFVNTAGGTGLTFTNPSGGIVSATLANSAGGGTSVLLGTQTSPAQGDYECYDGAPALVNCTPGVIPNAQTGTSYTVLSADRSKPITRTNSSDSTETLPQAGSAGFGGNFYYCVTALGGGKLTITPTTSTINGASTLVILTGQTACINSDNSNYSARVSGYATGTTGSIGGGLLTVGTCTSGTATIKGATTGMTATASPVTYPGDGNYWVAYVSASDTITVKVCATATLTPTSSQYNVKLFP